MAYEKTTWNSGTAPGIDADELNNLETQYDEAIKEVFDKEGATLTDRFPLTRMPADTAGKVLTSNGATSNPSYQVIPIQALLTIEASDTLRNSNDSSVNTTSLTPVLKKETEVVPAIAGTIRIKFNLGGGYAGGGCEGAVYVLGRIYVNGSPVGTLRMQAGSSGAVSEDFTIDWSANTLVQIYAYTENADYPSYIQDFRLYYTPKLKTTNTL